MSFAIRQDIAHLPGAWTPTVLAFAQAWRALGERAEDDPLSLAGQKRLYLDAGQRGTWFFLPWNRMFLYFFERILQAEMPSVGGPVDFTLPYWRADLQQSTSQNLPLPFLASVLPDDSANPLGGTSPSAARRWRRPARRHEPASDGWAAGRKPGRVVNRTDAALEAQVVAVRRLLAENPWAQVGSDAIAWELTKLDVEPPPRTIERILQREGLVRKSRRERPKSKGRPYPAPSADRPGEHRPTSSGRATSTAGCRSWR